MRTFLFAADQDLGDELDLILEAAIPGYIPIRTLLTAPRIAHGIEKRRALLVPEPGSFGAIEVRLHPLESIPSIAFEAMSSAGSTVLKLTNLESGQHSRIYLADIARGVDRIEGIPYGSYSAVFEGPGQIMQFPVAGDAPMTVFVSALDAEVEIPVESLGCIVLDPTAIDGTAHAGPIMVGVSRLDAVSGQETSSSVVLLRRRPYGIPFVPAGHYRVDLLAPEGASLPSVWVEPSTLTELRCSL